MNRPTSGFLHRIPVILHGKARTVMEVAQRHTSASDRIADIVPGSSRAPAGDWLLFRQVHWRERARICL